MILEALIRTFFDIAKGLTTLAGALPDTPQVIIDGMDYILTAYSTGLAFLNNLIGKPFSVAIITLSMSIILFFTAFKPMNWIFNKIRGSGN